MNETDPFSPIRELVEKPDGYGYRYPDGIRFNNGKEVNACKPSEALPFIYVNRLEKLLPGLQEAWREREQKAMDISFQAGKELVKLQLTQLMDCGHPKAWRLKLKPEHEGKAIYLGGVQPSDSPLFECTACRKQQQAVHDFADKVMEMLTNYRKDGVRIPGMIQVVDDLERLKIGVQQIVAECGRSYGIGFKNAELVTDEIRKQQEQAVHAATQKAYERVAHHIFGWVPKEQEWNDALSVGIYPAAVSGCNDERDYTQRDGFKNGWNAASKELGTLACKLVKEIEEWAAAERKLGGG